MCLIDENRNIAQEGQSPLCYNNDASIIDNQIRILDSEITNLQELQSLLLAKMGNLKQFNYASK